MGASLLFVCTGNTSRSPMAEAFAQKLAAKMGQDTWEISSAGLAAFPGVPVTPKTLETLKKEGIDFTGHTSKPLIKPVVEGAALIVTLSTQHRDMIRKKMPGIGDKVFTLKELAGEGDTDIKDPLDESQEFHNQVGAEIRAALEKAWDVIKEKMS